MMSKLFIFQLIALASCESILQELSAINVPKEGRLNFTELLAQYSFHAEEVEVITEDGYILTLFHVPGKKKPVLLVHGIGDSSNTWALRGNKSLAVTLAREGYDVWAGNFRGNRYGRKHVHLDPDKDEAFWDFSFHEMGFFDWPAMIDRVLKESNQAKLFGIGHSLGSSSFLVLTSLKPEYNKKVELLIALAPAAYLSHTGPAASAIATAGPLIIKALATLGINEILGDHNAEKLLLEFVCSQGFLAANVCSSLTLVLIAGADPDGNDPKFTSLLFAQYPAGVSRKTLEIFDQYYFSGKFAQFDYGPLENLRVYGKFEAPEYDLSKVRTKIALMYGENDQIITVTDVQRLAEQISNLVYNKAINKKEWNHIDFVWSREMDKYLFGPVIQLLDQYDW